MVKLQVRLKEQLGEYLQQLLQIFIETSRQKFVSLLMNKFSVSTKSLDAKCHYSFCLHDYRNCNDKEKIFFRMFLRFLSLVEII
jgi:hypothetical protein